jgi:hypothetical protein
MGTQAADSIGQSQAGTGSNTSTSTDVATGMVREHRTAGTLDTTALAADVQARTAGDPQARADLAAQLETQLSPVEQGQFNAALQVANDNVGTLPASYYASVEGQTFTVGDPDAPAVASWGSQPPGQGYKEAWDAAAARIGSSDPAAITNALEAQLYPANPTVAAEPTGGGPQPEAQAQSEEGIGSFFEGMVKGDFSDNNSWSATAGQVIGGFIPIVGQIGDARDTVSAIGGVIEGKEGAWGNLGLTALGWLPGIGDAAKGVIRGGEKALDAGTDVAQQATRHADDVADGAGDVTKQADELAGAVRTAKVGQNEVRWTANADGLPVRAEATLKEVHDGAPRSSAEQKAQSQTGKSGNDGDQGGHIIGHRFMPDQGVKNMFPQAGQFNNSAYRTMENEWADWVKAGAEVRVNVDLKDYQGVRPDTVNVSYDIYDKGGNLIYQGGERFKNEAGQVFDRVPKADIEALLNQ